MILTHVKAVAAPLALIAAGLLAAGGTVAAYQGDDSKPDADQKAAAQPAAPDQGGQKKTDDQKADAKQPEREAPRGFPGRGMGRGMGMGPGMMGRGMGMGPGMMGRGMGMGPGMMGRGMGMGPGMMGPGMMGPGMMGPGMGMGPGGMGFGRMPGVPGPSGAPSFDRLPGMPGISGMPGPVGFPGMPGQPGESGKTDDAGETEATRKPEGSGAFGLPEMPGFGHFPGQLFGAARQRLAIAGLSGVVAKNDKSPQTKAALEALEKPVKLELTEKSTLGDLVKRAKESLAGGDGGAVSVYVDHEGIKEAGASLDSPVAIDLNNAPLKTALRLALKQVGLAYCVRDGVVIISSPAGVLQELREAESEVAPTHPGGPFSPFRRSE